MGVTSAALVPVLIVQLLVGAQAPAREAPPPAGAPPSSAVPIPPDVSKDTPLERLHWTKDVDGPEPITTIEVRNDYGDIRARLSGSRTAEAWMVAQRLDPGPAHVGYTVERRGSAVALVVAYPPGRVRDSTSRPAKDSYDRLDLVVFVPEGVTLRAHTLRGQVEVRGLRSDVEASTLNGPIFVISSGALQARTIDGTITALPAATALSTHGHPFLLQSQSGAISLTLPPRVTPELRIETSGPVESPLKLKRRTTQNRTLATAGADAGARLVLITSQNGRVTVDRAEK